MRLSAFLGMRWKRAEALPGSNMQSRLGLLARHLPHLRLLILCLPGMMTMAQAQAPSWWVARGIIATNTNTNYNDFAAINQGQVKWLATKTAAELSEDLQHIGGADSNIDAMVASFSPTNNYLPVNAGQLKNVAQPFYDRLCELGLTNCYPAGACLPYPWSSLPTPQNDFLMANVGQAKYLFSFNFAADSDGDGIPDIIERDIGSNPYVSDANNINTNAWAQGQTNSDLYQSLQALTIPNAWAIYTNTSQVAVVADIRSLNRYLTVRAAEFFMDSTNGVVFGAGTSMNAADGVFNATNEMAQTIFTPSFPAGERHVFYIHAQDSNNHWCPFVAVILNPTVDDILNRIQTNYSAIRDLQFSLTFTVKKNNVVTLSDTVVVKMKGPYKVREEYANGYMHVQNENTEWWSMPSVGGGAMQTGLNGNFDSVANRDSDFFWDVALWRNRATCSVTGSGTAGAYAIALNPTTGSGWQAQNAQVDFPRGFVTQLSESDTDMTATMNYSNPMEVMPGVWLFTSHCHTLQFSTGDQIVHESILSDIKVNQGLDDALFNIPTQ